MEERKLKRKRRWNFIIKEINAIKTRWWQLEQIYFNTVGKKIQNWADSDNEKDELEINLLLRVRSPGGGDSHMKQTGMLVGNFKFNP